MDFKIPTAVSLALSGGMRYPLQSAGTKQDYGSTECHPDHPVERPDDERGDNKNSFRKGSRSSRVIAAAANKPEVFDSKPQGEETVTFGSSG